VSSIARKNLAKKNKTTLARKAAPARAESLRSVRPGGNERQPATPAAEVKRVVPVIVGIGASAGGIEALEDFFANLPGNTDMAFVVVQHLSPTHASVLAELLARKTRMKVQQARDGMPVVANSVYVIPPGHDLGILQGTLQLLARPQERRLHLPVDHFFTALAQDQHNKAIGVVLSGTGSDGTLGLIAIKAEGGITFAQEPRTAHYDNMPNSAIAAGCVDFVRSPQTIAQELADIGAQPYLRQQVSEAAIADDVLNKVFFLLRRATGHDFTNYKRSTITRRLHRRMALQKLDRLDDYVRYLDKSPKEVDNLFHDLLINVTSFFRDPDMFEALKATVLPRLLEGRPPAEPLRIWVPACSSGEEAYSIAMTLVEYFGSDWMNRTIQIFAGDIDDQAIERARAGFFLENMAAHVSEERLRRYFVPKAHGFQISKAIRDLCVFSTQDVIQDPPFSRMDLVCCRNLLIYLDMTLQRKVLARVHFALKPAGFLILGSSETIGNSDDLFSLFDKEHRIYTKKSTPVRIRELGQSRSASSREVVKTGTRHQRPASRSLQEEAERLILRHYGPPAVVIDEAMEIAGFSGHTGPYIEPASGAVSFKLLKMAHPDLGPSLRSATQRAIKTRAPAREDTVAFRRDGVTRYVNLSVHPLPAPSAAEHYYAVLFEPVASPPAREPKAVATKSGEKDRRLSELASELESVRNQMQGLVADYTTSVEDLQTANEEIQSSNEEMQSSNEELESAKEELQSTNEELATLNEELSSHNHELSEVNNDLLNLLASVNLPIVMLGEDLRIRRFTPSAKPLLNFIDADIGRPITDIKPNLDIPGLPRLIAQVIDSTVAKVEEAQDSNGRWYSVQVRPYKTLATHVAGAVLVCIDITELRHGLEQERLLAAVVRDSNDAVLVQDLKGGIRTWNPSAERLYGYRATEAMRMNIHQLIPKEAQEAHDQLMRRIIDGELVAETRSVRIAKDGRSVSVFVTASLLVDAAGNATAIATTEREIT
jgi:two-component system CheB/CheR fusion protein